MVHNLSDGSGREGFSGEIVSIVIKDGDELIGIFFTWSLVDTVEERDFFGCKKSRHFLVGEDHTFFDNLV